MTLARQIAGAKGCSILTYTGLEYSNSGVQAIRAVWCLQALAGFLDVPGGKLFKMRNRFQLNRILTEAPELSKSPVMMSHLRWLVNPSWRLRVSTVIQTGYASRKKHFYDPNIP